MQRFVLPPDTAGATKPTDADPNSVDAAARRIWAEHGQGAREFVSRLIWNARAGQDASELKRLAEIDRVLVALIAEASRAPKSGMVC